MPYPVNGLPVPGPHPSIGPANPRRGAVVQAYRGQLMRQSGPSCWAFVVEAVADIYGRSGAVPHYQAFNTDLLAAVINLYPRHDVGDRRYLELRDIEAKLRAIQTQLTRMRTALFSHVSRVDLAKIVTRNVNRDRAPNVDDFMRISFPQNGYYSIDAVNAYLTRAAGLAGALAHLVQHDPHNDAEGALLGSRGQSLIDQHSNDSDLSLTLQVNLRHPAATVGVRHRLIPRNYPGRYDAPTNTYDLTGVPVSDITEGGYHAILLVEFDARAHTLTYKDPNYGDARIIITFDHLRRMAVSMETHNNAGVEVQMFIGLGTAQIPALLRQWGDIPVFAVLPVAPPRIVPAIPPPIAPGVGGGGPAVGGPALAPAPAPPLAPAPAPPLAPAPAPPLAPTPAPWYRNPYYVGAAALGIVATATATYLGMAQMKPAPTPPRPAPPPRYIPPPPVRPLSPAPPWSAHGQAPKGSL